MCMLVRGCIIVCHALAPALSQSLFRVPCSVSVLSCSSLSLYSSFLPSSGLRPQLFETSLVKGLLLMSQGSCSEGPCFAACLVFLFLSGLFCVSRMSSSRAAESQQVRCERFLFSVSCLGCPCPDKLVQFLVCFFVVPGWETSCSPALLPLSEHLSDFVQGSFLAGGPRSDLLLVRCCLSVLCSFLSSMIFLSVFS